jgi:hypothetical protein
MIGLGHGSIVSLGGHVEITSSETLHGDHVGAVRELKRELQIGQV